MDRRVTFVLEETENHGQAIKRFRSLCDMHRVPFGEQGNLYEFVSSLREDRHFAMDFWAMVGDLSARERGSLSDEEMLNTIVEGSAGVPVAELPLAGKTAAAELKNLLAGVDIGAPELPGIISEPEGEHFSETSHIQALILERQAKVQSQQDLRNRKTEDFSTGRVSIAEALLRLEETSRELRDRLAAMEQTKIAERRQEASEDDGLADRRGESAIVDAEMPIVEPQVSRRTTQTPTEPAKARVASIPIEDAPRHTVRTQRATEEEVVLQPLFTPAVPVEPEVFAPQPASRLSRRGLAPQEPDDDPSIVVPLAAYAESSGRRLGIRVALIVVLLALAGAVWMALHRGYGQGLTEQYGSAFRNKLELFRQEIHDLTTSSPKPEPRQEQAPTQAEQVPSTSEPPQPVDAPSNNGADVKTPQSSKSESSRPVPQATPPPPVNARPVPSSPSVSHAEAAIAGKNAVRVSAAGMEENLVSSRVPVYPETAKAMGIEGSVIVETMISPSGTVDYARAISGDSHLRAAAEEAVMKWKYKPYLLNGRAVEATTRVRVDFRLPAGNR